MRSREHGSAILVVMIVISSLLAGAAILVSLQLAATRSVDLSRSAMSALYCAEAGLSAARPVVAANYAQWNSALGQTTEPSWLSSLNHDIDGDGVADFTIMLKDNDDEQSPLSNDLTRDNDLKIFIVSTCAKYPDTPRQVSELMLYNGSGTCFQSQIGGCGANGNSN